jgi:hypothetical protein
VEVLKKSARKKPTAEKARAKTTGKKKARDATPAKKRSAKDGPVAQVWAVFNRSPKSARKDLLSKAVSAGINLNTARTQYQRWKTAQEAAK